MLGRYLKTIKTDTKDQFTQLQKLTTF